jgi:2'-5' RNA ligase
LRCFIALGWQGRPTPALDGWLAQARAAFPELAVSPPENLHLTLHFLGEIGDPNAAADAVSASALGFPGWSLRFGPPGAFPSRTRPRVLWLGVDDSGGHLASLHRRLTTELSARDLPVEARSYRPHLTLARIRRPLPPPRLAALEAHLAALPPLPAARVESLILYRSHLGQPHARHQPVMAAVMI